MSQIQTPGLAALEQELGCSICTELLYQPLTLLDCLHTFCGSCLKEWFTAQGGRRQPHNSDHRFTCPSCRAGVRATRPNATVTTLLDMVLASQPGRARTEDEKKEIAERYKPGDSVFPPPQAEADSSEDEEDERLLAQIQEISLRESRLQTRREERREERRRVQPETNRARSSNPDTRHTDEGRARRRREEDTDRQRRTAPGHGDSERARRVEHQSSLRSLLSLSSETETMEEEILRQIIEEGLLNDIDLDNLGPAQEEELSERIADAYRRRHMRQSNSRPTQRRRQSPEVSSSSRSHARSHSAPRRSGEGTTGTTTPREHGERRPPVSRPHLLESSAPRPTGGHQRRNSEQASVNRRTSPVRVNQASNSDETLRPAARSSSDMTSERPRSSQAGRPRAESSSRRPRRGTESEQPLSDVWMAGGRERVSSRHASGQSTTNSPTVSSPPSSSHPSTPVEPSTSNPTPLPPSRSERRPRPASSRPSAPSVASVCYAEPNISCNGCGKSGIQYELHKRCFKCNNGEFHLCLRCYRSKKCCPEWAGFLASAKASMELMLASSNGQPRPAMDLDKHILTSFKYQRPAEAARIAVTEDSLMTNDNPRHRLETGLFCDICKSSANECWWKCDQCNDGDWGFCNRCVNQGRCCTHPLLPIRRIAGNSSSSSPPTPTGNVNELAIGNSESYKILSISTNCDICTYPIPASVTRFHCLKCNEGDYDVCTNCYRKLVATSKISKENGYSGWRRCLAGHRTIVIGFKDHEEGQRRTIVRGLVGGFATRDEHINQSTSSPSATGFSSESTSPFWAWKEGHERRKKTSRTRGSTTSSNSNPQSPTDPGSTPTTFSATAPVIRRFPPDGGVGLVAIARWSWYPEEGVKDELTFPRGAEIMEVENVNDDWFCGSYAGSEGLFPGNRVIIDREIV